MKDRKNRSIRWRVPFKTLHEHTAVVCIYDEDYNGSIIDLEGAINPFATEDNNSEELLLPIRSQTGYLRVIDNGDIADLMPSDNMNHYVELYVDDVLEWCGYMQADSFSEEWDSTPIEVEYPVISGIGVLEGLYLDENKDFGDITLASMMKECFDAACIDYDYIYIPAEAFPQSENYLALLRLKVSRFNFFKENGSELTDVDYKKYDAWSAMDVISETLSFFGWSIYERGTSLYIVSHGGNGLYRKIAYSDFGKFENVIGTSYTRDTIQLYSLEFDGDNHTKDILQGYNLFKISADPNIVGDVVPVINEDELGYKGIKSLSYERDMFPDSILCYENIKLYGGGGSDMDTEMFQYDINTNAELSPIEFDEQLFDKRHGACYGEYDLYLAEDLADKKNYNYKKAVVVNLYKKGYEHTHPTGEETHPFIIMRNKRKAKYASGAFVLNASTIAAIHMHQPTPGIHPIEFDVKFRMKCGEYYWDGGKWTTTYSSFSLHFNSSGKIDSNKTLEMPYNGAEGYIMPITNMLSGDVELKMYCPYGWEPSLLVDRLYFQNLKVEYFADDNEVDHKKNKINKYQAMLDLAFKNEKEIDLKIATYNKNMAGYALLTLDGKYVQNLYYSDISSSMRPEQYLLSKLKRIYGRKIEKLNIEVERTNLLPFDIMQYFNKKYAIASVKTDWSDEHQSLTILDVI